MNDSIFRKSVWKCPQSLENWVEFNIKSLDSSILCKHWQLSGWTHQKAQKDNSRMADFYRRRIVQIVLYPKTIRLSCTYCVVIQSFEADFVIFSIKLSDILFRNYNFWTKNFWQIKWVRADLKWFLNDLISTLLN